MSKADQSGKGQGRKLGRGLSALLGSPVNIRVPGTIQVPQSALVDSEPPIVPKSMQEIVPASENRGGAASTSDTQAGKVPLRIRSLVRVQGLLVRSLDPLDSCVRSPWNRSTRILGSRAPTSIKPPSSRWQPRSVRQDSCSRSWFGQLVGDMNWSQESVVGVQRSSSGSASFLRSSANSTMSPPQSLQSSKTSIARISIRWIVQPLFGVWLPTSISHTSSWPIVWGSIVPRSRISFVCLNSIPEQRTSFGRARFHRVTARRFSRSQILRSGESSPSEQSTWDGLCAIWSGRFSRRTV